MSELSKDEIVDLINDLYDVAEHNKIKYVCDDELYHFYFGEQKVLACLLECIVNKEFYEETCSKIKKDMRW